MLIGVTRPAPRRPASPSTPPRSTDPAAFQRFQQAQDQLSGALGRLLAVSENYPDLKSNENFLALQSQLEGTENRIAIARRDYNDAVRDYNTTLRVLPTSIWAATFYRSAKPMQPFGATEAAQSAPTVQFDLNGPPAGAAARLDTTAARADQRAIAMTSAGALPLGLRSGAGRGGSPACLLILVAALSCFAPAARAALDLPAADRAGGRRRACALGADRQPTSPPSWPTCETKTGRQLVVVTLPDLQGYDIEDYGYQLGRAWGIGQKGQNNGVLFIVVPSEHKVRIEVGYGLEPVLTDALSSVDPAGAGAAEVPRRRHRGRRGRRDRRHHPAAQPRPGQRAGQRRRRRRRPRSRTAASRSARSSA